MLLNVWGRGEKILLLLRRVGDAGRRILELVLEQKLAKN
jgi:hypothetical protein